MQRPATLLVITLGIVVLGNLPIWGCGLRRGITFWEFVKLHTVFGLEPEYVPEETFTKPLTGEELQCLVAVHEAQGIVASGRLK